MPRGMICQEDPLMTVGLTHCQLQGVYNIRSYEVCWDLRGGGGGGSVCQHILYSIHKRARKDSIPYEPRHEIS